MGIRVSRWELSLQTGDECRAPRPCTVQHSTVLLRGQRWRSKHAEALAALADGQLQHLVQLLVRVVCWEAQLVKTRQGKKKKRVHFLWDDCLLHSNQEPLGCKLYATALHLLQHRKTIIHLFLVIQVLILSAYDIQKWHRVLVKIPFATLPPRSWMKRWVKP